MSISAVNSVNFSKNSIQNQKVNFVDTTLMSSLKMNSKFDSLKDDLYENKKQNKLCQISFKSNNTAVKKNSKKIKPGILALAIGLLLAGPLVVIPLAYKIKAKIESK